MELKLFTNASPLFCFPLLIAPLMELKLSKGKADPYSATTFNRTAYGIETFCGVGSEHFQKAFNRTAYGIETKN